MKMESEYYKKVKVFMEGIPAGNKLEVNKFCKTETMQLFIDTIKQIMNETWYEFGWEFTFSNDYTQLTRITAEDKQFLMSKKK